MDKNTLKQILFEQKEEIKNILSGKIIKREVEDVARESLNSHLIKVIIGVRRSGKSVLAHKILENKKYGYVNFDDERLISVKTKDLNDLLETLLEINPDIKYLLLDEVQNVAGWELFVNRLQRKGYNIIVTGSNSQLLSKELATHLTGRHFTVELFPFSFKEFLVYKGFAFSSKDFYIAERKAQLKRMLAKYLRQGGFPELFKLKTEDQYLRDLYNKIVTRDVVERYKIKYVKTLKELALYALSNFGNRTTYHKLKNIFEIKSVHTIKNYLDYLMEAYLIFQVYPFYYKVKEQIRGSKKIYGIDNGLIRSLSFQSSPDLGRLMENVVFLELKRRKNEIYFFTDYFNNEIDFVVKERLKVKQLIQVCYDLKDDETRKREVRSLTKAAKKLKCDNLIIITNDLEEDGLVENRKIKIIPLWKWLLEKEKLN